MVTPIPRIPKVQTPTDPNMSARPGRSWCQTTSQIKAGEKQSGVNPGEKEAPKGAIFNLKAKKKKNKNPINTRGNTLKKKKGGDYIKNQTRAAGTSGKHARKI